MSYKIDLHPDALQELDVSYKWYEERSAGLGVRFIMAVDKRLQQIAEAPEKYPKKKGNYRETIISDFPFTIIYEVLKKQKAVFVTYIFHTKRNPLLKYKR